MAKNTNLNNAKSAKNNEFYTRIEDVEKKLKNYKDFFRGKKVLCKCNDGKLNGTWLAFAQYFSMNFEHLGLKKLTCMSYNENGCGMKYVYCGDRNGNCIADDFELEGVTEEVVVEYHKDEHKWVVDKQYFDADGGFIDHDTDVFTPYEKAEYLTIAEGIHNNFKSNDSWEEIVVADNYERYDALVDSIKRYYASLNGDSDDVAYEVEDIISYRFMELLSELDKKFKKKN